MIVTTSLAVFAFSQQARAEREARTAADVTQFLVDVFRVADPTQTSVADVSARDLIDESSRKIAEEIDPATRSRLLHTVGVV